MPKRPKDPEAESESLSDSEEVDVQEEHYEYDDFVVPDDEVDEGLPPVHDEKSEKKKKSRKRISKRQRPDPEDLELAGASSTIRATDVDALEAQLFREPAPGSGERERSPPRPTEDEDMEGSEKDGFIVDAEDNRPGQDFSMEKYTPKMPEQSKAVFEPSDIKSRFGLPEDELIRIMDLPERMQRNLKSRLDPSETELEQETDWLLRKVMANKAYFNLQEVKTKIKHFLQLYRVDKFETGFLQTYRIHLLSPELTEEDLWDMTRLDLEWGFVFEQKRRTRAILIEAGANSQILEAGTQLESGKKILLQGYSALPKDVEELLDSTSDANCFFEVEDLSHYLETVLTTYEPSGSGGRLASNRVLISGRKLHMHELAAKSGVTPVQLADNIREMRKVHISPKNSVKPQELAFDYLCDEFKDEAKVLLMLSNYMKKELIGQPALRSFVRAKYAYHVRVYTSPTEKGKEVLDIFHPCYRTKSLGRLHSSEGEVKEGKDVDSFGKGDLWLEVVKCEAEGLITVNFLLPWTDWKDDKILMELKAFYLSGEGSDEVEADWNEFRTEILKSTLTELYESLQKEYRRYLTIRAEENVLRKCREEYQKMLMQPPYILRDEEWSSPRVFSFVSDPASPKYGFVALVVLDTTGEVMDSVNFTALLKWEKEILQPTEKERNSTDIKTLQRMLLTYRPDVLVLGANSLQTVLLRRVIVTQCRLMTMEGFEKSLVEWNVDPSALLTKTPDVMMGSLEAPRLFAESHRGKRMLPDMTPLQRQAVSLGRYLQHPAAELLSLWTDPNENLTMRLKLHMLQKLLPEKQLLDSLEEAAVKVCSHLGADINYMLDHTHLRAPLSFIPGLGMIKAHSIFENLMRTGHLLVRQELLYKDFLKVRVFQNCIGFIIIKAADKSDPLDRTRIHPEHYGIAKKIAASALDSQDEDDERNVERVMKNPERLDRGELDLDDYAKHLEVMGMANMKSVILMVVKEMKQPFHVSWGVCEDLPPLKVLYLTTGETEYTLRPGVIVHAMVTSVMADKPPRCKLECGLDASAKGIGFDAKEGSSVRARVTKLIAESKSPESLFFQAQLSCIDTDLQSHEPFRSTILQLTELDPAFAEDPNDWKETVYMEEEMKNGQKYIPRVINHPKFRNVGLITAVNELERKDIGECLFRPSSRGSDHVTCTFKFYDFVYSHLDIVEEGKPADNMLGSRFKIGDEVYESLQEIIERYVVPVATLTKDAIAHNKFIDLANNGMEHMEAILRAEKQSKPTSIPYHFTVFPQYPQFFVLCYTPKERTHKEYIKVKPKGLFFHERLHPNINYLISWFKRHYSEPAYQTLMNKSKAPIVVTANLFAVPSKKNERPMTPHRDEDRRYDSGGRSSPAYSGRADSEKVTRHTPRRDTESVEDQWSTPKRSSDPWATGWGTPRTPVEEEPSRSKPPPTDDQEDDRQRGGRGARRGSRGGRGCYVCGEEGHFSKNCPKSTHGPAGICFNCEKPGHLARDCPEESRRSRNDRRPSRRDREEPKEASKPGEEDRNADAWGDSSWEAPTKPQGWGPTDKMHVDEDKWG